jgi:hypothetical protein
VVTHKQKEKDMADKSALSLSENIKSMLLHGKLTDVETRIAYTEPTDEEFCISITLHFIDESGEKYSVEIEPGMDAFPYLQIG